MIRLVAFVVCLAVLAPSVPASAEADGPDYYRIVGVDSGGVLNIRSEPSAESPKVGQIPADTDGIRNLGCTGGPSFAEWSEMTEAEHQAAARKRWCRVEYAGVRGWVAGWHLAEGSAPATPQASAASGPSFDCKAARPNSIDITICGDARLSALDREVARLYGAAQDAAEGDKRTAVDDDQRQWVTRRDDCVEAEAPASCATALSMERIVFLLSGVGAADADGGITVGPTPYRCENDFAFAVTVFRTGPSLAYLREGQRGHPMELVRSASGSKYQGEKVSFWSKGDGALVTFADGPDTRCTITR